MKLANMIPLDREIENARHTDAAFRRLWDESEFAREVALKIVTYRDENNLTQAQLGRAVGMTQPAIARLENGEDMPTLKTLVRVSAATGLKFNVAVAPSGIELATA
ncbi:helix-turn-helix transcriptional regulator [Catellatospora sp. NPDC049609]|uniref:helix-turn-helix domain-containing protein n=1 Tax=Catellatospora sp. NPDC049609 TaxID=3155505 RepID=UPI00341DCDA8